MISKGNHLNVFVTASNSQARWQDGRASETVVKYLSGRVRCACPPGGEDYHCLPPGAFSYKLKFVNLSYFDFAVKILLFVSGESCVKSSVLPEFSYMKISVFVN